MAEQSEEVGRLLVIVAELERPKQAMETLTILSMEKDVATSKNGLGKTICLVQEACKIMKRVAGHNLLREDR
jgi:hypothetical protein